MFATLLKTFFEMFLNSKILVKQRKNIEMYKHLRNLYPKKIKVRIIISERKTEKCKILRYFEVLMCIINRKIIKFFFKIKINK